jgi:hypothetical protein
VHELVVGLVAVHVPMMVDWPVSPVKIPVPPVVTASALKVTVFPLTVPFSETVPNVVPPAKMSTKVPLSVNAVELEKMMVVVFVVVKAPDTESTPEPVKLPAKTAGGIVDVLVAIPMIVPEFAIVSAWTGTAILPITTRANKIAASERIIAKPPMSAHSWGFGFIRTITADLALLEINDLSRQALHTPQINADFERCIARASSYMRRGAASNPML